MKCPKCGSEMEDNPVEGFSEDRIFILSRICPKCGFISPLREDCHNIDHAETGVHEDGVPFDDSCQYPFDLAWARVTNQPRWVQDALRTDHERNHCGHEEKVKK